MEKAPKKAQGESEEDRKRAEIEERKRELCSYEKAIYNTIEGEFTLIDEAKVKLRDGISEAEACGRIWETFIRNGSTLYFNDISAFKLGKNSWEIKEQEKEECLEGLLQRKESTQMIFMLKMSMKFQSELHDWDGKYKAIIGQNVKRVVDLLTDLYGFQTMPQKHQQILDGTHELYTKE